jgi:hypothetical protein
VSYLLGMLRDRAVSRRKQAEPAPLIFTRGLAADLIQKGTGLSASGADALLLTAELLGEARLVAPSRCVVVVRAVPPSRPPGPFGFEVDMSEQL